jgi:hypothetical protein
VVPRGDHGAPHRRAAALTVPEVKELVTSYR